MEVKPWHTYTFRDFLRKHLHRRFPFSFTGMPLTFAISLLQQWTFEKKKSCCRLESWFPDVSQIRIRITTARGTLLLVLMARSLASGQAWPLTSGSNKRGPCISKPQQQARFNPFVTVRSWVFRKVHFWESLWVECRQVINPHFHLHWDSFLVVYCLVPKGDIGKWTAFATGCQRSFRETQSLFLCQRT